MMDVVGVSFGQEGEVISELPNAGRKRARHVNSGIKVFQMKGMTASAKSLR